jgi:hypothetical protein
VKIDRAFAEAEAKRLAGEIADMLAKVAGEVYVEEVVTKRYTDKKENRRFPKLDPAYAQEKKAEYGDLPIMVREGHLFRAVKQGKSKVGQGIVTITFSLPSYAAEHDESAGNLPRRPPVEPNNSDAKALVEGIARRLKGRK